MTTETTTCPRCGAPVQPAYRGDRTTWLDEHGRGAGFNPAVEYPASCTDGACDWEEGREGTTSV